MWLPANASYLHRDAQGSVRQITSAAGVSDQRRFYLPYGAVSLSTVAVTNPAPDTKGWIGERFDADAGLQYLNARYYDPQLGMFLQPDWWEVMQPGVGTNRYSYSFGDPVNGIDPSGHQSVNQSSSDPFRFLINLFSMGSGRTAAQTTSDIEQKTRQGMQNVVKGYAYGTVAVGAGAVGVQATVACFSSQVCTLAATLALENENLLSDSPSPGGGIGKTLSGPVVYKLSNVASPKTIAQIDAYVVASNRALKAGALSATGRVSTTGALRREATERARAEAGRASAAGAPYAGHVGHAPDTTWTNTAEPYDWLDLEPSLNSSLGAQARWYPQGYQPTSFSWVFK